MIRLDFCKKDVETRKKIVKKFCELNLNNRQSRKIHELNTWCETYLSQYNSKYAEFENIVQISPEDLIELKKKLRQSL